MEPTKDVVGTLIRDGSQLDVEELKAEIDKQKKVKQ